MEASLTKGVDKEGPNGSAMLTGPFPLAKKEIKFSNLVNRCSYYKQTVAISSSIATIFLSVVL